MSDSVRPHRRQPTRLPRPWDSPGKDTGVGCHLLLQCMKMKREREVAQSCPTLRDPMDCSLPGSSVHDIFQARVLEWGAIALFKKKDYFNHTIWILCFTCARGNKERKKASRHLKVSHMPAAFRFIPKAHSLSKHPKLSPVWIYQ